MPGRNSLCFRLRWCFPGRSPMAATWLTVILLSVVIHIIFLFSIFEIYFKSPLVHGMQPYQSVNPSPAKRLMLFVADGLRADKFFNTEDFNIKTWTNTPAVFLKSVCDKKGICGVSHTHVPTESRPGHVALIAGFYEDVSAVAKGWKENPVEFDSFFNESRFTWSWGSPDILPMFAKGSSGNHVFINTYNPTEENFAMADASLLDMWVFEKFQNFLMESKLNSTLQEMLQEDKIVIFLHLLGLDTIGHGNKPTSREYHDNILLVDRNIEKIVNLFEDYFHNDGLTSYIFTSDHGMTDWGSHGAGSEAETMTPIVAWGAGITQPQSRESLELNQEIFVNHQKQIANINQVDIAPLMAALLGVPFPMNSVGVVPLSFLNTNDSVKADILYKNAKQILSQCKIQEENKRKTSITFFFQQFSEISEKSLRQIELSIQTLLKKGEYEETLKKIEELISSTLMALHYYQTYDRFVLSCTIIFGFIGWMIYVATVIIEKYTSIWSSSLEQKTPKRRLYIKPLHLLIYIAIIIFTCIFLSMKMATVSYYLYFLTPLILWVILDYRYGIISATLSSLNTYSIQQKLLCSIAIVCGLEIIVISFFSRALLSVGLLIIAFWPWTTILKSSEKILCIIWSILLVFLAVFPLLPVAGKYTNYNLVCFTGWLFLLLIAYCSRRPEVGFVKSTRRWNHEPYNVIVVIAIQMVIIVLSIFIVQNTASSLLHRGGLPYINQIFSWIILGSTFILPFFGSSFLLTRLLHIGCSLSATYMLMSTSYESLFLLCLCCSMFIWICLECKITNVPIRLQNIDFSRKTSYYETPNWVLAFDDVRRAYFSLYFLITAFFGTGNIASINSFDPASVYAFITVFSPFIMGALLMVKVMIPFLVVACTVFTITKILKLPPWSLFMIILIMCDFMGLHFFVLVKDTGSWLDIGMSISHYVVMLTATIYFMLLYSISQCLISKNIVLIGKKNHSY